MTTSLKVIIIVGGGVGGLELATQLGKKLGRNKKAKIVLIDKNDSHLWKPLLHEIAADSLNESMNNVNYLMYARNHHFHFQLGFMSNINRDNKTISLSPIYDDNGNLLVPERTLVYDTLVLALGSSSNDFNIPGVKEHCFFLDSIHQARILRQKILNLFLQYFNKYPDNCNYNNEINNIANVTIVGGGATGIELAAEIHNTAMKRLCNHDYKNLTKILNITLVEADNRVLPALSKSISYTVHNELTKIGIQILTNTKVKSIEKNIIYTSNNKYIKSNLIVWTAGIKIPDFMRNISGLETNSINQLVVQPTLQTTRDQNIFAIGDCAFCTRHEGGFVPPRAQAAHQMANLVFHNILMQMENKPLKAYIYKDYGSLISLSSYTTVGNLMGNLVNGSMTVKGRIARLIYISLYRIHQITLYGYLKTSLIILVDIINRFINRI